jgi:hypothetical protein
MAIIWADFPSGQLGLYGSNRDLMLNGVWAAFEAIGPIPQTTLDNDPDPVVGSGGRVLRCDNGSIAPAGARFALPAGATNRVGIGFRLWVSALPSGNWASWQGSLIAFRTLANASVANICVLSNGALGVARDNQNNTPLGQTAVPVITANTWNHVEIALTRSDTVGEIEIRVNGRVVLDLDTLDLGATDTAQIFMGVNNWNFNNINKGVTFYKDLVFWDGSGSDGNDFQGSVSVRDLVPDGDVSLNWTPSTGSTGFNLINVSPPNDTTFISAASPAPAPAEFSLTDLPDDVTSVRALLPIVRSRKTDGGDADLQNGLTPNGTDYTVGADNPLTTAFTYRWDVTSRSPDTLNPWTPLEVDNADLRIDRTL